MFFDPGCIPCIVKQAYRSGKMFADGNPKLQMEILKQVCREVGKISGDFSAPLFSVTLQEIVEEQTGLQNLYEQMKAENFEKLISYEPYLEKLIDNCTDKFEMAVRAAILGNAIDVGANPDFSIDEEINKLTADNLDIKFLPQLKADSEKAKTILYIGDNFEEAFFDKYLLRMLAHKKLIFVVRSKSILNDVTRKDAENLGIDKICRVIESGSRIAGTDLSTCTPEFLHHYNNADLVISKGQGNYETLLHDSRPIYFLFKVKCRIIENACGHKEKQSVLLYKKN